MLAAQNTGKPPEAKAYANALDKIKTAAMSGRRECMVLHLPPLTVSMLTKAGYRVEQGDAKFDPRDAMCFTISW